MAVPPIAATMLLVAAFVGSGVLLIGCGTASANPSDTTPSLTPGPTPAPIPAFPGWAANATCDMALISEEGSTEDLEVAVSAPDPETGYPIVRITAKKALEYVVRVAAPAGCKDCYGSYELKLKSQDEALKMQTGPQKCPVWPDFMGGNAPNNTISGCKREGIQWYHSNASSKPATRELTVTGIAGEANSRFVIIVAYAIALGNKRGTVRVLKTSGTDYIMQPQPKVLPAAVPLVTYEGYVIDLLCVYRTENEPGWIAPDLTMALKHPEAHHAFCLNMDVCRASGYGLVEMSNDRAHTIPYRLKYTLDKRGNDMLVPILKNTTGTNIKVKATGVETPSQVLVVSEISVSQAGSPATSVEFV